MAILKQLFLILFAVFSLTVFSQEVTNIVTRQLGEKIEVSYSISNSTTEQLFFVSLYCSIDGKEKILLKSVTGDVGDNISGGKEKYIIVWDVLKDVDELNSAEFFVKIELKKDGSKLKTISTIGQKKWLVGYNGSFLLPFGVRASYLGNWGGYFGVRFGRVWNTFGGSIDYYQYLSYQDYLDENYNQDSWYSLYPYWDQDYSEFGYSLNAGVTKRILNKSKFQLHAYAGLGYGYWGTYNYSDDVTYDVWNNTGFGSSGAYYNQDNGEWGYHERAFDYSYSYIVFGNIDLEGGLYASFNRLAVNLGFSYSESTLDIVFGLGYKF